MRPDRSHILFALLGAIVAAFLVFNNAMRNANNLPQTSTAFNISTSIYPLYFFTAQIAGNAAHVSNITPVGVEPHDYEPSAQNIITIEKSKLLVLNGALEPWAKDIKENLSGKTTKILEVGDGLFTQEITDEHGGQKQDPHIWLSPVLAQQMVQKIADEMVSLDSANEATYRKNADGMMTALKVLDLQYKQGLEHCARRDIMTSHAAFGYLASTYNLKQIAIADLSPDEEPALQKLADLAQFARKNNVKYIFFESMVSPKFAETLAQEVGAQTLVLNPIEGLTDEEIAQGKDYITEMQQNLQNLRMALECQ